MQRVLVVDDEEAITTGLVDLFNLDEISAIGATDRAGAEELIRDEFFAVILADLRLRTEAEGLKLLESIRTLSPRSKVATLTGYATEAVEAELMALGVSIVLHKPLEFAEIVEVVREMLAEEERLGFTTPAVSPEEEVERLYATVGRVLFSIPQRKYGFSAGEAEELVQQVWCLYLEKKESIRMPKPWLAGTMINLCRQEIHRKTRQRAMTTSLPDDPSLLGSDDRHRDPEAVLIIRDALGRVDDRTRLLCELIGIERKSYQEVSRQLNLPIGSIGPLYMRAKSRMKTLLEARWN
jgi:RNA polymerase sigma factor (sigma-70 family)